MQNILKGDNRSSYGLPHSYQENTILHSKFVRPAIVRLLRARQLTYAHLLTYA